MTRRLFGTDGVRGVANQPPLTPDGVLRLAMAAGAVLRRGSHPHRVVIAKDTRLSGYMVETALTSGFVAMGMDVRLVGPMPTPAVAQLVRSMRADLGVMISASHNPFQDNGIKLFGADGYKLSDSLEAAIEARLEGDLTGLLAAPAGLGRVVRIEDAAGRYVEHVKSGFPRDLKLDGLKLVVDCAHGAAWRIAPMILQELGAEVIALGVAPDGTNINERCGATDTRLMQAAVLEHHAHLGIALDGDADRLVLSDESGARIDGDQIMALIARSLHQAGQLTGGAVVATVMSNLGLERWLGRMGLGLHRTPVGDRYVVERMRAEGCNLGGEQSGHVILSDHATTGDGLLAALKVLASVVREGRPASETLQVFAPLPQILRSVRFVREQGDPMAMAPVMAAVAAAEAQLGSAGRLLVRKSGTEPVIRVMAEGEDAGLVAEVVEAVTAAIAATQAPAG